MNLISNLLICICSLFHYTNSENADCPSEGIAYLTHSKCTHYNICLDGEVAEMKCPFFLYYNPETTQCDFPENVAECKGGTRPPITSTTISTELPTSTEVPPSTTELPPDTMTECGQTIRADYGAIQYKLNKNYDAGELCVFMITFAIGAINATFTLDTHGLADSESDVVTVLSNTYTSRFEGNLGFHQRSVTFIGYGAEIIFRTKSSSGTGFQLSFRRNSYISTGGIPRTNAVFNTETYSPLSIPFPTNHTSGPIYNFFFFTSGSQLISEPDTSFRVTIRGSFGNPENSCSHKFVVYSFEDELKEERTICWNRDDGVEFEFLTHGLIHICQEQKSGLPMMTGVIVWEKVSTR